MKKQSITIAICLLMGTAIGQTDSLYFLEQMEQRWETVGEATEETAASEEILELLEDEGGKMNLNALSYEAAIQRLQLSDYQYYQLQLYLEETGPLVSIYELAAIAGFSERDVQRLRDRVVAEPVPTRQEFWRNLWKKHRSTLTLRDSWVLERQAGYDPARSTHYPGSRDHLCFRYTFESQDKLSLKISGEKDAGEQFFRGAQRYGFDFYSGSFSLKNMGLLRQAVVGDYRLNYGQGLVLGSAMLSGRGGDISQLRRFSTGIRAIAPTNEGNFLRGAAATLGSTSLQGTLFWGNRFGTTQHVTGANVAYTHRHFRLGGRVACLLLRDTLTPRPPGHPPLSFRSLTAGIDYQTTIRKILLFGEVAITSRGKPALLQGFVAPLSAITQLAVLLRHYSPDYEAPLGNALGANSQNHSESGVYISLQHILTRRLELKNYFDYYQLHDPSYRLDAPASILDAGATLTCSLSRNSHWTLGYQYRDKPINIEDLPYKRVRGQHLHRLRFQWQYQPLQGLTCKSGLVWKINVYSQPLEHFSGLLLYQDFGYKCWKERLAFHGRIAYFDTQRYEERLYAYEDDVYYAFTIGSYYYKGIRGYLVVRLQYKAFSCWIRVGQTYYLDRTTISSGLNQIDKPHKTELRVQTSWRW